MEGGPQSHWAHVVSEVGFSCLCWGAELWGSAVTFPCHLPPLELSPWDFPQADPARPVPISFLHLLPTRRHLPGDGSEALSTVIARIWMRYMQWD